MSVTFFLVNHVLTLSCKGEHKEPSKILKKMIDMGFLKFLQTTLKELFGLQTLDLKGGRIKNCHKSRKKFL